MVLGGSGIQHPLVIPIVLAGIIPNARAQEGPPGLLFSEGFEDPDLTGRGWYDGRQFTLSDEHAAAGKRSIQYHFPEGRITPDDSSGVRHLIEPTEVVYLRFSLKLSPGWSWTGRPYGPHLLHFLTTANGKYHGPARSHLTLYIEPVNGKLRLATQDIQNQEMPHGLTQGPLKGGYNGQFFDSQEVLFDDDQWHLVEAMFKLNSLDREADRPRADGELRGWVDGRLVIERTDVVFRSTDFPDMKFNQFLMLPYFHHGVPHDQTLWIDELAVGTQRIGPVGQRDGPPDGAGAMERIEVSKDKKGFVLVPSGKAFVPWGFNYDHDEQGRLIEDYWDGGVGQGRGGLPGDEGPGGQRRPHPPPTRQVHGRPGQAERGDPGPPGQAARPGREDGPLPRPDRPGLLPQAGRARLVRRPRPSRSAGTSRPGSGRPSPAAVPTAPPSSATT